jgi:hypothetical protein
VFVVVSVTIIYLFSYIYIYDDVEMKIMRCTTVDMEVIGRKLKDEWSRME